MHGRYLILALAGGLAVVAAAAAPADSVPAQIEFPEPPPVRWTYELGWDMWDLDGNRQRPGLYARPNSSPWLSIHDFDAHLNTWFDFVDISARHLFSENYDGEIAVWSPGLPARLRAWHERTTFFGEPLSPGALGARGGLGYDASVWPHPGMVFSLGYQTETLRQPGLLRGGLYSYETEEFRAAASVPIGTGDLSFQAASLAYRERDATRPSSQTNQYSLGWNSNPGPRWVFGANARWSNISQPGLPGSRLFALGLNAQYKPSRTVTLDGRLNYRDIELGPTQTGYVTEHLAGTATLSWRILEPFWLRVGLERGGFDRLNATQTATESFKETRAWARGEYRGPRGLRATLRYQYRGLDGLSPSAVPLIGVASPLLIDKEHSLDLRTSILVGDAGLAYGLWQWRERNWEARGVVQQANIVGLGVNWPASDRLTLSGDAYLSTYATNALGTAGLDADTLVWHVGLAWQPTSLVAMQADYHQVVGYHGEDNDRGYLSAGCDIDLGGPHRLRFGYRRDDYSNVLFPGLDYDTDLFSISFVGTL